MSVSYVLGAGSVMKCLCVRERRKRALQVSISVKRSVLRERARARQLPVSSGLVQSHLGCVYAVLPRCVEEKKRESGRA